MKNAKQSPQTDEMKRVLVRLADLHTAVVAESEADVGEGVVTAFTVDGVLVITAHGDEAYRIELLLQAAHIANPIDVPESLAATLRAEQ